MKISYSVLGIALAFAPFVHAQKSLKDDLKKANGSEKPASAKEINLKHDTGSKKTALDQDELSADVQDLIQEQTDDKVIELLEEAEGLMAEATDKLDVRDTGGETIAIETEIIEKIYEAAKQKQKSGKPQEGEGPPSSMMEMMERMMGKEPGDKPGDQPGDKPGEQAGDGNTGDSDKNNDPNSLLPNEGNSTIRRIPKSSGTAGSSVPRELQKALDAFNKANAEKK